MQAAVENRTGLYPNTFLNWIALRDHTIMRAVHHWRAPRWIRLWMICATRGGDGWLWYSLAFLLGIFGGSGRFEALAAAAVATGSGIALFLLVKCLAGRRRPCAIEPHCWATLLPPDQFSFPSGHTITAFSVALSIGCTYPALMAGLLFCAFSIAISRVLLGMHFLSDVIAGALIGCGLAWFAVYLVR